MSTDHIQGRAKMAEWEASKPKNFFTADRNLQHLLQFYLDPDAYAAIEGRLQAFGADCATLIDEQAKLEDRIGNHPKLQRWTHIGERVEDIEFHHAHATIGTSAWQAEILACQTTPGRTVEQVALVYLLTHNGEAGHMCSIACTSGLIKALQRVASPEVRAKFLPPLLDPNFQTMQHAAQFLTEVQGGSDVGANSIQARESSQGDGTWRITGEKWFCSNVNADQFLMTARPEGASPGTKGLGLFVVPRRLEDGSTNGFYIRRLKDKLGTRTMASAELDFIDAVAYPVGDIDRGFKHVVEWVLNTSRLMNATSCAGFMRRAAIEAGTYACAREAFGQPIAHYPLVQEAVADIVAENYAALSVCFALGALLDKIETGQASPDEEAVYRMLVNLNKYITSIRGTESVHRAIEVLGGNGAIESFSILPRLYRDMVVLESWEGTHNVLCLQVWRDMGRYHLHEAYLRFIDSQLGAIQAEALSPQVTAIRAAMARLGAMISKIAAGDEPYQQAHVRRMVDAFAHIGQAALMAREADWELAQGLPTHKPTALRYFVNRHLIPGYDPLEDSGHLGDIEALLMSV